MNVGQALQEMWQAGDKKASRLDSDTLALDNQGLAELLMALGAKVPTYKPQATYRERLLETVEAALFRKP